MDCGPESIWNSIWGYPMSALASTMACRREPGPSSSVVVTVKTAGWTLAVTRHRLKAMKNEQIGILMEMCFPAFWFGSFGPGPNPVCAVS